MIHAAACIIAADHSIARDLSAERTRLMCVLYGNMEIKIYAAITPRASWTDLDCYQFDISRRCGSRWQSDGIGRVVAAAGIGILFSVDL